jgi:long-subunit fatty acid transport protein
MLDYFAQQAQGKGFENLDQFYEYLAYYNFLINPDSINTTQYTPAFATHGQTQRRSVESRGAVGEMVFSFGGNYSNKLYLGVTLGIESLHYTEESTYEEVDPENGPDTLKSYRFNQNLTTDGNGVNLKLGMIYRANDYFRLGIAFHTPTWYTMKDLYKNTMRSEFDGGKVYSSDSPDGEFNYELTTPFKAIGSMAFIFGQYGVLDADYEFSDYSESRFHSTEYAFIETNSTITHKYTGVHTLRLGTEWRFQNLSFRGGINFSTSPLTQPNAVAGNDFSKKGFSLGIGMRDEHFFLDLGYLHTLSNQYYQPYTLTNQDVAGVKSDVTTNNFTVTLGVKF